MPSMQFQYRGFSKFELVAGLGVAGVLAAAAVPSFTGLIADARRAATLNELIAAFNHARHKSVVARRPVVVCGSTDGLRCDGRWANGWIGFVEPSGWKPRAPVEPDAVLVRGPPVHRSLTVAASRARFHFRPFSRRSTNGTVAVCSTRGGARAAVVSWTGRVRITRDLPAWAQARCGGR